MTRARRGGPLGTSFLVLGCLSCVPLKDLSSYSAGEGAASDPGASPERAPPSVIPRPADPGDTCAALGGFVISETRSCYMFGDNVFSWQDARNFCQAWGGDLIELESPEENAVLAERIGGSVWIGAHDGEEEGTFRWARGNLIEYAAWGFGQPDNLGGVEDCAELRALDNRWNDIACTGEVARKALCEEPSSSSATAD